VDTCRGIKKNLKKSKRFIHYKFRTFLKRNHCVEKNISAISGIQGSNTFMDIILLTSIINILLNFYSQAKTILTIVHRS